MDENNQTNTLENGEVHIKTENKKKWKIPRVNKGLCCYSMFEWAVRWSFSDMILGVGLAFLFFWLSTRVDESQENYQVNVAVLVIFGVIFCIVALFGLLLFIGLASNKFKVLLRVYCWYALILAIIVFVLFFISAIFIMVNSGEIGTGFLAILLGAVLSGYFLYIGCLVYSIHMNILENKEEINLKKSIC